jgi:eukaryotic-like serine/threonine-protein kinase
MSSRLRLAGFAAVAAVTVAACGQQSSEPTQIVMPTLTGKYWTDAEPELRHAGWTGVLDKGPDVPVTPDRRNSIVSQQPSPGAHIAPDARITLQFGI